jgi:hypothetical protein
MKVISQLACHFWSRGSLAMDQADYLVRQGFVRAQDLTGYESRRPRVRVVVTREDVFDAVGEDLTRRRGGLRRPSTRPTGAVLGLGELCGQLRDDFNQRADDLRALTRLADPLGIHCAWQTAVVALRNASEDEFRQIVRNHLRTRPSSLGELWRALSPDPFHELVESMSPHTGSVQAFRALLSGLEPGRMARYAWILRAPEVAAVGNLLNVYRRFLVATQEGENPRTQGETRVR